MSRISSKNTLPERRVRQAAHSLGLRFRLHRSDLPGTPDVIFPKYRIALFVHGCFRHRHPGCSRASVPATNTEKWQEKFKQNVDRDAAKAVALANLGWQTEIIWECETKSEETLKRRLKSIFGRLTL